MTVENVSVNSIILFLIGLLVSTLVIYVVTFFMRHRRSVKLALFTAIIGSIVYVIAYALLGTGFLPAVLGGIAWLLALKIIYRMGVAKSPYGISDMDNNYHYRCSVTHRHRATLIIIQYNPPIRNGP